ncbi:MAG TPA: helicase-associated domain-containing protein [Thermoflexales bacterium]|nr:helicase-associated domain-containing protein [Thermoflexales bacterium]
MSSDPALLLPEIRAPGQAQAGQAADFQRDLGRYWRHVRREGVLPVTQTGWVYKSAFKAALAAMNEPPDAPADESSHGRAFFIRRALRALGTLAYTEPGALDAVGDAAFLGLPLGARIRMLFEVWRDGGMWHELDRIETPHTPYPPESDAPPELGRARATALALLAAGAGGAGRWIGFESYANLVRRIEPGFLLRRKANERQYPGFGNSFYNPLARTPYFGMNNAFGMSFEVRDPEQGWTLVERQMLARMVAGPLRWMGLVTVGWDGDPRAQVGHSDAAGFSALCLTPVGAWLLGLGPEPEFIEGGGRVVTQPNFTILAMDPVSDAILIDLDHFAEPKGGDRAAIYELTRQSVYRGQRAGWSASRIAAFLEARQGAPIPPNVRRSLDEWQQQHDRVVFVRKAQLLQYADEAARSGAVDTLGLARLTPLGPRFDLLASDAPFEDSVDALREAGWMPLVSAAGIDDHADIARLSPDGSIVLKQAVPSLHALAELELVAAPENGSWALSAARVRNAMSRGIQVEQALASLANLADQPLPVGIIDLIRGWSSFYGEGSLRDMAVLTLANAEVLEHALADPEFSKLLQAIPGALHPIALVERRHISALRELLIARGVALTSPRVETKP